MFQSVLKKRKNPIFNIVGWFLLTVATLALAFLGLTSGTSLFSTGGAAAEVNSKIIAMADVQEQVEFQIEQRRGGGALTAPQRKSLENRVLDGLIKRELILQAAADNHIYVSDNEILDVLTKYPAFQEDGRFSKSAYKRAFQQYQSRGINIEERIRNDILVRKIQTLFQSSLSQIGLEKEKEDLINNTKVNIRFLVVDNEQSLNPSAISGREVKSFLEDAESMKKVEEYYNGKKTSEFTTPEKVRASIILIKAPEDDMKKSSEALDKIQKIKEELKDADFGALAKKYSEDPISKSKDGDLGYFEKGSFDPKVESAAFSMKVGEVSDFIKSEQGYNIIKLTDRIAPKELPLDAGLKDKIARRLLVKTKSEALVGEITESVKSGDKKAVEGLARKAGLKWQETEFFNLGSTRIPKIGINQEFLAAAFSLKDKGQLHNEMVKAGPKSYVLSLVDRKIDAPKNDPLMQSPYFKELFTRARVDGVVNSWTDMLVEEAKVSKSPSFRELK